MNESPLHIVLYEPEIPPNTGNIARLCACTGCELHLIHPLGFEIDDKQLKRAGLDYWPYLNVNEYVNWDDFRARMRGNSGRWYALSTKGDTSMWDAAFSPGDVLVFGPESRGLPDSVRTQMQSVFIPMRQDAPVRSLNLSTACGIVVYEALRQLAQR